MVRAVIAVALAATLVPPAPAAQAAGPSGAQAGDGPSSVAAGPQAGVPAATSQPPSKAPAGQAAAKPSPAAERVARALTTQPNWNDTVKAYASSLGTQISAAVKAQGGEPPDDVEPRVRAGIEKAVAYDEVVRLQAQALGGRFGEDELRTIAGFYESGPGKKLVSELPGISRQVIEVVQQRISAAIPHIVQDVAPSLAHAPPGSAKEGTAPDRKEAPKAQGRKPPAPATPPQR